MHNKATERLKEHRLINTRHCFILCLDGVVTIMYQYCVSEVCRRVNVKWFFAGFLTDLCIKIQRRKSEVTATKQLLNVWLMVQFQARFSSLSGFYSHNLFLFPQITEVHLCNRKRHQVGWPRSLVRQTNKARKYLSILSNRLPHKNCTIENCIIKFSVVTMSKIIPFNGHFVCSLASS